MWQTARTESLLRALILGLALCALPLTPLAAQEAIFTLDLGLLIWTWVLFLLTVAILAWKVYPWIARNLEQRQERIQRAIDEARAEREKAKELVEEQRRQIQAARREAQEILEEGRKAGERLREDILREAREEQEKLLKRARWEIEREREKMAAEIRDEAVELSIAAAERLLRTRMDSEENRDLVRDSVAEMT